MGPLGISKTVLLGELARAPQLRYGPEGTVRALLSLTTRVLAVSSQGDSAGCVFDDAHLVYCEGSLAERTVDLASGALVYLEGRNREQQMRDPGGKAQHVAFVSASVIRHVNNTAATEGANTVTLVGTVMVDPTVRYMTGGQCESVKLRIMTIHRAPGDSNDTPTYDREYHEVSYAGRVADYIATHVPEGSLVFIEGRNQPTHWRDGERVNHRTITIVGHNFQLLHSDSPHTRPPERNLEVAFGYDVQLPPDEARTR